MLLCFVCYNKVCALKKVLIGIVDKLYRQVITFTERGAFNLANPDGETSRK